MKLRKYKEWDRLDKIAFSIGVFLCIILIPIGMYFRTDGNYWVEIYLGLSTIPMIYIIIALPLKKKGEKNTTDTIDRS